MSPATRCWLAFPAVGAGVIHLALALAAPLPFALVLALFGAIEFFWGVLTFARERVPVPRVAAAVALVPTVVWGVSLGFGVAPALSIFAMLGACLLELIVVVALSRHLRRPIASEHSAQVVKVLAAVVLVAGITGASLAVASLESPATLTPPSHGH